MSAENLMASVPCGSLRRVVDRVHRVSAGIAVLVARSAAGRTFRRTKLTMNTEVPSQGMERALQRGLVRAFLFLIPLCLLAEPLPTAQDRIQRALDLLSRGALEEAEKEARAALDDPDVRPVAYSALGAIRLQQGKLAESEDFLKKALELNPRMLGAQLNLGQAYNLQGKSEQAGQIFREALRQNPSHAGARFGLGQAESARGNYRVSLEVLEPLLEELKRGPDGLVLLATNYLGIQDKESAAGLMTHWRALRGVPANTSLTFAHVLARGGLVREAIEVLEKSKIEGAPSFDLSFNLAGYYFLAGEFNSALANYQVALNFNEHCIDCYRQVARIAEQQNDPDQAMAYLIMAKRRAPEDPDVLFEFGKLCLQKDLIEDATQALERAHELRPDHEASQYVLASARVAKKKYPEARALLEQLLEKHPDDPTLNYALGAVYFLDVELEAAERYLRRSIELNPDQLAAYYYLGLVAERKGEEAEAAGIFRDLLRRYPNHAPAHEALGTVLFKQRDYEAAQRALEKAIALKPDSGKAHYQLGMLYARLGQREASTQHLEIAKKIQEKEGNSPPEFRLLVPH
jgi:tetratricopeptide (TPR) repeat protein